MIRFLQISDIHFTDVDGNDDEYSQLRSKFLDDIASCRNAFGQIDYILICGDIAFSGMDSQYKSARVFIDTICGTAKCDKVLLVPGNHDKKWDVYGRIRQMLRDNLLKSKNLSVLLKSKVKEPMALGILYAPFKQYYKLAGDRGCINDVALKATFFPESDQEGKVPKFEPSDRMYWTQNLGVVLNGFHLFIHGSNTSLLSDKDDNDSKNLLPGKHLQVLPLQAYNVVTKSNEIHMMMLHHPMSEIVDPDGNIAKDLDSRFQLQLYGHVHKQSSAVDGAIKIYSGALQPEEGEEADYFPVYNVIDVDVVDKEGTPQLKVDVYSRKWNGSEFVEYTGETKTGDNALTLDLKKNDAWEKTVAALKSSKDKSIPAKITETINPYAVKNHFLHCGRERDVILEMYGDEFDRISPNRIKYLYFLRKVEEDGKINELNELLKKYDQ